MFSNNKEHIKIDKKLTILKAQNEFLAGIITVLLAKVSGRDINEAKKEITNALAKYQEAWDKATYD